MLMCISGASVTFFLTLSICNLQLLAKTCFLSLVVVRLVIFELFQSNIVTINREIGAVPR